MIGMISISHWGLFPEPIAYLLARALTDAEVAELKAMWETDRSGMRVVVLPPPPEIVVAR